MNSKTLLYNAYKKMWDQRAVLTNAPAITIDITQFSPDTMDYDAVRNETGKVISYLLSVRDVHKLSIPEAIKRAQNIYGENQPFWFNLVLDYLDFLNLEENEELTHRAALARQRAQQVLDDILEKEAEQKAIIEAYAAPLKEHHFAIDAEKMMRNYLNMCRQDHEKAWDMLIKNPGYFSPIITTDADGKTILTPDQAIEENKKIGKFLKTLSV